MTTPVEDGTAPFTVLVVCTGNLCRSPLAEQLLRARFDAAGVLVNVQSAGTRAMAGDAMTPEAAALSLRYGGVPTGHSAQLLTRQLVEDADLVLTADRQHRREVVTLHPRASRYAYTLNQFARLVAALQSHPPVDEHSTNASRDQSPRAALRDYVGDIAATRGFTPPPAHPEDDDIEDPYRRSSDVYDRSGRAIDQAVTTITAGLGSAITEG